jgi:vacuolar protein sorting-associated protein 18
LLTLQDEIVKGKAGSVDRSEAIPTDGNPASWQPGIQRTLLSQNFAAPPTQNGHRQANSIGRNLLSAGDRLRDLIVPDALVTVITAPAGWIPGIGGAQRSALAESGAGKRLEKLRSELEDILASACPLCESVIAGLDKSFTEGEPDTTWEV